MTPRVWRRHCRRWHPSLHSLTRPEALATPPLVLVLAQRPPQALRRSFLGKSIVRLPNNPYWFRLLFYWFHSYMRSHLISGSKINSPPPKPSLVLLHAYTENSYAAEKRLRMVMPLWLQRERRCRWDVRAHSTRSGCGSAKTPRPWAPPSALNTPRGSIDRSCSTWARTSQVMFLMSLICFWSMLWLDLWSHFKMPLPFGGLGPPAPWRYCCVPLG